MACRKAYQRKLKAQRAVQKTVAQTKKAAAPKTLEEPKIKPLFFGVDSRHQADDLLQNNISLYEWIVRNKIQPNFMGRNMVGENCLTKNEIRFIHRNGTKIAAIFPALNQKKTEQQGIVLAKKANQRAAELEIPEGTAIFLEISANEPIKRDFLKGFASTLLKEGYVPGFKANTDARYDFDREFSRGMQTDADIFKKCLIWAVEPTEKEYDGMTTTHLIHPDRWHPFAPSGITRNKVAIWQYGRKCHPIEDDDETLVTFNLDLVQNKQVIARFMF